MKTEAQKLKIDIIKILEYFDKGLADVKAGSGEAQPQHKEIKSALKRVVNFDLIPIKMKKRRKFIRHTVCIKGTNIPSHTIKREIK